MMTRLFTFVHNLLLLLIYAIFVSGKEKNGRTHLQKLKDRENAVATTASPSRAPTDDEKATLQLREIADYRFRNASHEELLLTYLFQGYDPVARAVIDTAQTVNVGIDFVLLRIHGLVRDERSQVLVTTGLVIAEWKDERLMWKPEMFGNLTNIIVEADKIWRPELAVMNEAEELMPKFERIRVLLHHDGSLHWEPGGTFRTTCDIDIAYFPFDTQHCPLLIGAYSYYSTKMNITNMSSSISTHDFRVNGEWHVYRTSSEWNITVLGPTGDGYAHVIFTLHLKRRYKFYIMNIVLPCIMLSVLIMIGFCLPPEAGEKISLGISVLLAFTVFLMMIAGSIPRTSLAIPLIVTYLMATMTLGTLSVCMTVLVLNVHHRGQDNPVQPWLRKLVLVYLARMVFIDTSLVREGRSRRVKIEDVLQAEEVWRRRARPGGVPLASTRLDATAANTWLNATAANTQLDAAVANTQLDVAAANGGDHAQDDEPMMTSSLDESICRMSPHVPLNFKLNNIKSSRIGSLQTVGARRMPWGRNMPSAGNRHNDGKTRPGGRRSRSETSSLNEWHEMARVLDRTFFWLIFMMMTVSAVVILFYPKYIGNDEPW